MKLRSVWRYYASSCVVTDSIKAEMLIALNVITNTCVQVGYVVAVRPLS